MIIPPAPIEINCNELRSCNSIGIRYFMRLIGGIGSKKFFYTHVPLFFVDSINTFSGLLGSHGNGRVESFYLDYFCPSCQESEQILTESKSFATRDGRRFFMTPQVCGRCGGYLSPGGDLSDILEFLRVQNP